MHWISRANALPDYKLELEFSDGAHGVIDLSDLVSKGVFAAWDDPAAFAQVRIGPAGELAWGEEIDMCPDSMYMRLTGARPEDVFLGLRRERANA